MIVKLRMIFSKKGRAVFISQLDLMRTLQRAFQRAGYPLKYSEGFNPHPLLSVALPMSVGSYSDCEILDFKMDTSPSDFTAMAKDISMALPDGLEIQQIYVPEHKVTLIKWIEVEGLLEYDIGIAADLVRMLMDFFHQDSIPVMKKSKRGEQLFDCKPHIKNISIVPDTEKQIRIHLFLSAQNPTINPNILIKALPDALKPDFSKFHRIEIFDEDMKIFR